MAEADRRCDGEVRGVVDLKVRSVAELRGVAEGHGKVRSVAGVMSMSM